MKHRCEFISSKREANLIVESMNANLLTRHECESISSKHECEIIAYSMNGGLLARSMDARGRFLVIFNIEVAAKGQR